MIGARSWRRSLDGERLIAASETVSGQTSKQRFARVVGDRQAVEVATDGQVEVVLAIASINKLPCHRVRVRCRGCGRERERITITVRVTSQHAAVLGGQAIRHTWFRHKTRLRWSRRRSVWLVIWNVVVVETLEFQHSYRVANTVRSQRRCIEVGQICCANCCQSFSGGEA